MIEPFTNVFKDMEKNFCCFRLLAKDNNLQTSDTQKLFFYFYVSADVCCLKSDFIIHRKQDFSSARSLKIKFDLTTAVPAATGLVAYALVLTK